MIEPRSYTGIRDARVQLQKAYAYERPGILEGLHLHMRPHLWLRLVGEFWALLDGDRRPLTVLLKQCDDWRHLMNDAEARGWKALPGSLFAWRGCYAGLNEDGLSFSLDNAPARAAPFVPRYRYNHAQPVLLYVRIDKEECVLKVHRGQPELLVRSFEELDRLRLGETRASQ